MTTTKRKPTMSAQLLLDEHETRLWVRNAERVDGALYDILTIFESRSDGGHTLELALSSSIPNRHDRALWQDDAVRHAPLWLRALVIAHRPDLEPQVSSSSTSS